MVKIKELYWSKHPDNDEWYSEDDPSGNCLCLYWIRPSDINPGWWDLLITGHREESYRTPELAMQSAQDDYIERIRFAIDE